MNLVKDEQKNKLSKTITTTENEDGSLEIRDGENVIHFSMMDKKQLAQKLKNEYHLGIEENGQYFNFFFTADNEAQRQEVVDQLSEIYETKYRNTDSKTEQNEGR